MSEVSQRGRKTRRTLVASKYGDPDLDAWAQDYTAPPVVGPARKKYDDPDLQRWSDEIAATPVLGEVASAAFQVAPRWGSGQQLFEGLTQGVASRVAAARKAAETPVAGGPTVQSLMEAYGRERERFKGEKKAYEAANPLRSAFEEAGASTLGVLPVLGAGEAGAARALARIIPLLPEALTASRVARGAGTIGRGAAEGAASGLLQSGLSDRPLGDQVVEGAKIGGVIGPLAKLLGGPVEQGISPRNAEIAKRMIDLGVPLRTSDIPGASMASRLASRFVGESDEAKARGFTRALSRTFGGDTDTLDTPALRAEFTRLGKAFDVAEPLLKVSSNDTTLASRLQSIRSDVGSLDPKVYSPLTKALDNVDAMLLAGDIDGGALKSLRGPGGSIGSLTRSSDGTSRHWGKEIEDALQDSAVRNSPPDLVNHLKELRRQYKNALIADKVTDEATGLANPGKLRTEVERKYGSAHENVAGDIGTLGLGGEQFLAASAKPKAKESGVAKNVSHLATGAGALGLGLGAHEALPIAEHLLAQIPGGTMAASGLGAGVGAGLLGLGALQQTQRGTARALAGLPKPWWAGREAQPLIPLGTALGIGQ